MIEEPKTFFSVRVTELTQTKVERKTKIQRFCLMLYDYDNGCFVKPPSKCLEQEL